ncbi:pyridoxal phosphate-dependent aminotransferase [Desulfobulbus alkaliphilus]|uniref:pyridoxal phosphate-dependent aminotransferase n=1 Tax=Desulfobulbus alkaliphilus TaxID=869814 RepID=UPI00196391C3|nr:pyridoxal phosphate-dependent aminotransferase [Desulfobulbus alkaliphilus]MBM9538029.1 pyridoxal phosphate-dependent aminotransferase [Desulfobulbus alkaliphilus]
MSIGKIVLADRVLQIPPSPTLAVNAKAKALRAAGADILNFSVGEPDLPTPTHVCNAGKQAIYDGHTRYTPVPGILELREAICARFKREQGWEYTPDEIQVSCGGKHGLYNIFQAILNPGDEVLIPLPYWVSYPPMVQLAGGTPVFVPLREENGFDLEPSVLEQYATSKTKAIILNSPSNPTGAVLSLAALEVVAAMALEHGWLVVSDDMYEEISYTEGKIPHILHVDPRLRDQVLISNGVSKSYAMTGWRIGYTAGPLDVIKAMNKIQSQSTSNPAAPSQYAALAALTGPQDFPALLREAFLPRRSFFVRELQALEGVSCVTPMGAFYVFPNFSAYYGKTCQGKTIDGSVALADYFLSEARVASVPGAAFGADDFIRFSFATSLEVIGKGMERIKQALKVLQ